MGLIEVIMIEIYLLLSTAGGCAYLLNRCDGTERKEKEQLKHEIIKELSGINKQTN